MAMSPQNSGRRWEEITLLAPVQTRDDYGNQVPAYFTLATCDAQVQTLAGREFYNAEQVQPEMTLRVTLRYDVVADAIADGSIVKMWVQYRTRFLDILAAPTPDSRDQWVNLICKERLGRGPGNLVLGGVGKVWTPYVLSAQVDGAKTVFTLPIAIATDSFAVVSDGLVMTPTEDFTLDGTTLTMVNPPQTNLIVFA